MKTIALTAAALAFSTTLVHAADAVVDIPSDWTGFYVGLNAGYGGYDLEGTFDMNDFDPGDTFESEGEGPFDLSPEGIVGGVHAGYNYQIDQFVLGIEADLTKMDLSDSVRFPTDDVELSTELDWMATVRGRVGVAFHDFLLYGTAGAAFADFTYKADADIDDDDPNEKGSVDVESVGLVLGGGAEYAINESWSLKGELLYVIFNEEEDTSELVPSQTNDDDSIEIKDLYTARIGISYRF
jgi:outer membrane immunogenic protein